MTLADHAALLGTIGQDVELLALAGLDAFGDGLERLLHGCFVAVRTQLLQTLDLALAYGRVVTARISIGAS